jgi:murein DD-endopeptidase MepM/ murein hydrolase activator NlpD
MSEWILPFEEKSITCRHGVKDELHPNGHRGTDFGKNGVTQGTKIPSPSRGKVVISEWHEALGNVVVILHGNVKKFSYYCHLVEPGAPVGTIIEKAGDILGKVGNTGRYSFGAHLHCGISDHSRGFESGAVYDIVKFVKDQQAAGKKAAPAAEPAKAETPVAEAKPAKK